MFHEEKIIIFAGHGFIQIGTDKKQDSEQRKKKRYMARIVLKDGVTLKGARRMMTKHGGSFRITKRNGRLYTFKKFKCVQPNTAAQMECRELLKRANKMAREDIKKTGRKEYWEKKACEMGYKTAMGCARAWYIAELKGMALRKRDEGSKDNTNKALATETKEIKTNNKDRERREVIFIAKRWKTVKGRRNSTKKTAPW